MKPEEKYRIAMGKLNEYLYKHKMRHTIEREMVLGRVCELRSPFDAEQLIAACQNDRISRTTVKNTLSLLTSARILHCLFKQYESKKAEYELVLNDNIHMQMRCMECGRVVDFKDLPIENLVRARKYSNFKIEHFSLYVYGRCKTCRKPKQ